MDARHFCLAADQSEDREFIRAPIDDHARCRQRVFKHPGWYWQFEGLWGAALWRV